MWNINSYVLDDSFQEVEIINNVQDLLKKTIDQSDKQIKWVFFKILDVLAICLFFKRIHPILNYETTVFFFSRLNRNAKQNLEMDWSDKKEALEIDTKSGALRNEHTDKQFYSGAAKFEEM